MITVPNLRVGIREFKSDEICAVPVSVRFSLFLDGQNKATSRMKVSA